MRSFPREVHDSDFQAVPPTVPRANHMGVEPLAGGNTFVLGPGYQVIENGQVPQALPGQAHDSHPLASSNAAAASASTSAIPQRTLGVSSPLSAPSSSQGGSLAESAPSTPTPSGSPSVQPLISISPAVSSSESALPSLSPFSSIPSTSSNEVATSTTPPSTFSPSSTSSSLSSVAAVVPATAVSRSNNAHGAPFWAGIALLSVAVVATLITVFVWWLRVRKRTHRRPWESHWRWGRTESCKFPEDAVSSSGTSASWWRSLADRDVGEARRSTSNLLSSHGGSSHKPHLPTLAIMSPFTHGPYPTVRPLPLELRHSDTSVPGLMQDIGLLRVANLVAGDILTSGDESSRPPTALDDVGTPRESSAMFKPRYLSLNGSGLDVPWIITPSSPSPPPLPPLPQPPLIGETAPLNHNRWKERLERSSTKPAEFPDPPPGSIETWRDSLRNNIASALEVIASTAHAPTRPSVAVYDWQHATPAVVRAASITSRPWTLEETREGAGIVHIRGVPDPPSAPSSSGTGTGTRPPTPTGLRPPRSPPPRASLVPPHLPHLPLPPQVPRTSRARSTSTKRQHGSRRRRSFTRRSSSSASSVGSDMSRASGATTVARWSQLSEKEEAARRALRQRRLQSARKRRHGSSGPVT